MQNLLHVLEFEGPSEIQELLDGALCIGDAMHDEPGVSGKS